MLEGLVELEKVSDTALDPLVIPVVVPHKAILVLDREDPARAELLAYHELRIEPAGAA